MCLLVSHASLLYYKIMISYTYGFMQCVPFSRHIKVLADSCRWLQECVHICRCELTSNLIHVFLIEAELSQLLITGRLALIEASSISRSRVVFKACYKIYRVYLHFILHLLSVHFSKGDVKNSYISTVFSGVSFSQWLVILRHSG